VAGCMVVAGCLAGCAGVQPGGVVPVEDGVGVRPCEAVSGRGGAADVHVAGVVRVVMPRGRAETAAWF